MSPYSDYFLKFPDQQTALEALCLAFGDNGEGVPLSPYPGQLDPIGVAYRDDTPEGQPAVARDGWLANVRMVGALPAGLQEFAIEAPAHPVCRFA